MPAYAPPTQLAELAATPATNTFRPKRATVLSYGLGADSTAILLMYLANPTAHGLEPDLSDLIVVHAVTGDEWEDSLSCCDIGKSGYHNLQNRGTRVRIESSGSSGSL
ncbi:hypothetical protein [Streptomyces sp. NPDC007205]|uniref:hypothetical protein n=1 Tax=Streptomyces sp. NPDC007205 TaxID=3154316 RepID=UPI0033DF942D